MLRGGVGEWWDGRRVGVEVLDGVDEEGIGGVWGERKVVEWGVGEGKGRVEVGEFGREWKVWVMKGMVWVVGGGI